MAKYTAMDVARWFIARNQCEMNTYSEAEKLTLFKLVKLLYYAEGCHLALNGASLFDDPIAAWERGPAVESVWESFDDPYRLAVDEDELEKSFCKLSQEDINLLEEVYGIFGSYTAVGLINKSRGETPWIKATSDGRVFNHTIDREIIKEYFKEHYVAA